MAKAAIPMSRNAKIIVLALLVLLAVFVGLLGYWSSVRHAKQTMVATASVVSAKLEKKTGKNGRDKVIVTLSYIAGTRPARGNIRVYRTHPEMYPAGRSIEICYDPGDPTSIRAKEGACG